MPFKYEPRVKETTTTTGTGAYTLAGAITGYSTFAAIGNGNSTCYCCTDGTNWEIGAGTYTAAGTTLGRTYILKSTNPSGNWLAFDWGAGSKDIFCIFPYTMLNHFQYDSGCSNATTPSNTPGADAICIGDGGYASGSSAIAIGNTCKAAGYSGTAIGYNNALTESNSFYMFAFGNGAGNKLARYNEILLATGYQDSHGDTQAHHVICMANTTNDTQTSLGSDSYGDNGSLAPAAYASAAMVYDIMVVAMQYGGASGSVGTTKAWSLKALAYYAAGTPTRVGTTAFSVIEADAAASAWACALDFTNAYPIRVTGEANKSIRWAAYVRSVELAYAA